MRVATEGSLPPVMPQGNLVEVVGREVRQGSPGELMVESTPSRKRRPPCKTNKEMSDEAADAAALTFTYLVTTLLFLWHLEVSLDDPLFGTPLPPRTSKGRRHHSDLHLESGRSEATIYRKTHIQL